MLPLMELGEEIDFSFCMRSKNCIFIVIVIIIINIVFVVVVVMFQNHQAMANSCGCCWYSGAPPPESRLLEFLERLREDGCRGAGG